MLRQVVLVVFVVAVVLALQSFNLARLAISGRPGRIVTRRSLRALRLHHPERTKLRVYPSFPMTLG